MLTAELFDKIQEGLGKLIRSDKQFEGIPSEEIMEQILMRALKT